MALAPFLDALLACDLPPSELAAKIKAKLPAGDATELEELIAIARPKKRQAIITAYATALAKAEKADAKRKRDREGIAARRASGDIATRVTSATRVSLCRRMPFSRRCLRDHVCAWHQPSQPSPMPLHRR